MFIFLLKLLKTIIQYFTTESSVVEILFPNTEKVLENPTPYLVCMYLHLIIVLPSKL
jgi:hypothetical protein